MKSKNVLLDVLIVGLAIVPIIVTFIGKELPKKIDPQIGLIAGFY